MTQTIAERARLLLPGPGVRRAGRWIGIVLAVVLLLYYPVGMALTHTVDDNPEFAAPEAETPPNGSRAVAIAAALIEREVDTHRWVANDPWFLPPAALDNMPNYQQGIVGALARFAFSMVDQVGRARGSSQTDNDLQEASGQLQYPGTVWLFDLSTSLAPTTPSEARYRKARRSLLAYNDRLSRGAAVFERRADNLQATLDRIALDLGSSSAALEDHIDRNSGRLFDTAADDMFYGVKGQLYAYMLILRELGQDFGNVVTERQLRTVWTEMLRTMQEAAALEPLVVSNGRPDGIMQPNHLAVQGFYLLRARTQLREIVNILQK